MKINGFSAALISAAVFFGFSQCTNAGQPAANNNAAPASQQAPASMSGIKVAIIDVDSLLANYNYNTDLNEALLSKSENYQLKLTEDMNKLQKEYDDFKKKVQNQVYSSAERAQQEENRILRKEQTIREQGAKYEQELQVEGVTNMQKVTETILSYLREYNKTNGYDMILQKSATLLVSDNIIDITGEILDGLNEAYKPENEK